MSAEVQKRLSDMHLNLPEAKAPVANYLAATISGYLLYVSGQLPFKTDGTLIKGHLGHDVTIEDGHAAARLCALHILAQAQSALGGSLDKIKKCVKLTGFVASTAEFTDHPKVINGASDLMVAALGDAGKHARAAVGVSSLPLGAAVEVEAIFEI